MNRLVNLHLKIERQKIAMNKLAEKYGLGDPRVLKQSQLLDRLIVQEQRRRMAG